MTLNNGKGFAMTGQTYQGLSGEQVKLQREKYGSNILTPAERTPWWILFMDKFKDPIIRILLVAAFLSLCIGIKEGEYIESIGIIAAIFLATTIAFFNEYKAGKEFDILNQVNDSTPVTVLRDGELTQIPKCDLVVDDIIRLETGEEIPADCLVLEATSLQVNESSLTGESVPVTKTTDPTFHCDTATYPANQLLRGTYVTDGYTFAKVTAVGDHTEIGVTARAAMSESQQVTPLTKQLDKLSHVIGIVGMTVSFTVFFLLLTLAFIRKEFTLTTSHWYVIALLVTTLLVALLPKFKALCCHAETSLKAKRLCWLAALFTFAIGSLILVQTQLIPASPLQWLPTDFINTILKLFMISVTIIVVAVPEGLPMSVTLSLAYSMRRMTATNNLVRKLSACETIGATTVICSDKTGTLTMNEMRVHELFFPEELRTLIYQSIALNTTANLTHDDQGELQPLGNPTEGALLLWLAQQKQNYQDLRSTHPIIKQWPFTTERKFMATAVTCNNQKVLLIKGAPEIILARCSKLNNGNGEQAIQPHLETLRQELALYQAKGMRTIAFAIAPLQSAHLDAKPETWNNEFTWIGFAAINDPVRPAVPGAIHQCQNSGIHVKVVTGDTQTTAIEIARQIHLWNDTDTEEQHITGKEFAELPDEQARLVAEKIKVMSRARPMDKKRLIELLQRNETHVVAVTGDGVNDGPALKTADVGLAMGKTGTAVAREAGDIILLDDSFNSIVNAIKWGRSLYENIQRFILFQLTINVTALCIAVVGPLFNIDLPLTVSQMLWINLIMDTLAALALATEPPHDEVMNRNPRNINHFIITPSMMKNIFVTATIFVITLLVLLGKFIDENVYDLTIFFSIFVLLQFWNLFNMRSLNSNASALKGITKNRWFIGIAAIILIGQILLVEFGGKVFRTEPLPWHVWLAIFLGTSPILWISEIIKAFKRLRQ